MANARNLSTLAQGASTAGVLSGGYGGTSLSSVGSAGNVLFNASGTAWSSTAKIVQGTSVASTSGTAIDFTSIPSWVKRLTVIFNGVSLTSTGNYLFQIGTGGTPTTTGYVASSGVIGGSTATFVTSATNGIPFLVASAATTVTGTFVFLNVSSNNWIMNGVGTPNGGGGGTCGGNVTLAGTLDMVRITNTATGTNSFDAGTINILYE